MISYLRGCCIEGASKPSDSIRVIAHICNDVGAWGAGFVVPLAKAFRYAKQEYLYMAREYMRTYDSTRGQSSILVKKVYSGIIPLGVVQLVDANAPLGTPNSKGIYIANMVAQRGCGKDSLGDSPIRYDALNDCLSTLKGACETMEGKFSKPVEIHMPRIGCGLAGGDWRKVEPLVSSNLNTFQVYVYDLT